MNNSKIKVNNNSVDTKYQQVVNAINESIDNNILKIGDSIPSVNSFSKTSKLSRDTVFKAFTILKNDGIIESIPNKGYYVASNLKKILLLLNTFKAYKEVLYGSFIDNLPKNFIVDLQFHHYNIENFKNIIRNSKGKYYKYIVMNIDHNDVPSIVSNISNDKLLFLDLNVQYTSINNYIFQDFGKFFYSALNEGKDLFKKYKKIIFIYPSYTYHPKEAVTFFNKFCVDNNFNHGIISNPNGFKLEKNVAYISVSDRVLGSFLEQCRELNYEPGVDVGFLSYNETPMKKFIYKGITVISTDFKDIGRKAAEFINSENPMQCFVPTRLIIRESL